MTGSTQMKNGAWTMKRSDKENKAAKEEVRKIKK